MLNTTSNPPKMGNIPLAAVQQWIEADSEDTASSWNYVSGLLSGILIYRPDITEEVIFLVGIAAQRAHMAANGSTNAYATITPKQRLDALADTVSRMKSHSIVLGQFFTRSSTKQAAIAGMNQEIESLTVLWAMVKADLSEVKQ